MSNLNVCNKLYDIIYKLTAISDFSKRVGDDSYILEDKTPLGIHLILGDCIDDLRGLIPQIK